LGVSRFAWRGIIEGYYGPPWSHADRLAWIERLGRWGMNLYVRAPKNDRLQRDEWRTPYPEERMGEFAELVAAGARAGVEVGFSVSPGLSIEYSSRADVELLVRKLHRFVELGSRFVSLGLDDVPSHLAHDADRRTFRSLAAAHASLAHALQDALGPGVRLWLVPTDYLGVGPTDYLEELGGSLDPAIEVGWTGRTVVSPTIAGAEAAARSKTLGRRLLVWDNFPVSDGPMRPVLHLGPYAGRAPELADHVSGVVLNVMEHARASAVAVRTAADWLRDPEAYDAERSWERAVEEAGEGAGRAFALFAAAHRFSALLPDDRDAGLERAFVALRDALRAGREASRELGELASAIEARRGAADEIRTGLHDRALAREIEPWLEAHRDESERMRAAVELLEKLAGEAPSLQKVLAFFTLEGRLERMRAPAVASYGPRRALYPQLASLRDGEAGFAADPALFLDRCLADEVVRFAEERARAVLGVAAFPSAGRS
jgi:hyaluronoglucosaminidase